MLEKVKKALASERGVLSEYGLLVALIAVACLVVLGLLGKAIATKFKGVGEQIEKAEPIQ